MNNYSQNNFKQSKIRSGLHLAVIIIGGISLAGFVCGAASALLDMLGL